MKRLLLVILVVVLLVLGGTAWFVAPVHTPGATFIIHPGQSAAAIADSLHRAGLIRHPLPFRLWVRATGAESHLGRGTYHFEGDVSLPTIVEELSSGLAYAPQRRVTIPEGLRADQMAGLLAMQGVGDSLRYMQLMTDTTFIAGLLPDSLFGYPLRGVQSLEGFLFPETYYVPTEGEVDERELLARMVRQFCAEADSLRLPSDSLMTPYEAVILASIIEKEALVQEERPLIASVFTNRLRIGMALQACPTVLYALAQRGQERQRLLYEDLDIVSPYNTYTNPGLPPAPICSPSLASLRAALSPADTRYLYFVADGRGRHRFSRSFEEHKKNRWEVQRGS